MSKKTEFFSFLLKLEFRTTSPTEPSSLKAEIITKIFLDPPWKIFLSDWFYFIKPKTFKGLGLKKYLTNTL